MGNADDDKKRELGSEPEGHGGLGSGIRAALMFSSMGGGGPLNVINAVINDEQVRDSFIFRPEERTFFLLKFFFDLKCVCVCVCVEIVFEMRVD